MGQIKGGKVTNHRYRLLPVFSNMLAPDAEMDALIRKVLAATTRDELAAAMRALDRVLTSGHYSIPQWYSDAFLVGYRPAGFVLPAVVPPYYQPDSWAASTWWASPANR